MRDRMTVGSLRVGQYFVTVLTRRLGIVLRTVGDVVAVEIGGKERELHHSVVVEVSR